MASLYRGGMRWGGGGWEFSGRVVAFSCSRPRPRPLPPSRLPMRVKPRDAARCTAVWAAAACCWWPPPRAGGVARGGGGAMAGGGGWRQMAGAGGWWVQAPGQRQRRAVPSSPPSGGVGGGAAAAGSHPTDGSLAAARWTGTPPPTLPGRLSRPSARGQSTLLPSAGGTRTNLGKEHNDLPTLRMILRLRKLHRNMTLLAHCPSTAGVI